MLTIHYLVYLIPVSLLTGPFFPGLFLSVISINFLFLTYRKNLWVYYKNKIFFIFLFFYIYIVINSFLSESYLLSLESSLFYLRFYFFSLSIWYFTNVIKNFNKYFLISIVGTLALLIFDSYFQFIFGYNILGYKTVDILRISSFFKDELIMGSYVTRILPLIFMLSYMIDINSKFRIYFLIIISVLSFSLVALSGERTAFFLINLFFFLSILLIKKDKIIFITSYLISIISFIVFTSFNSNIFERLISFTLKQSGVFSDKLFIFSKVHTAHYISAFNMFNDHVLFGIGPKLFSIFCNKKEYYIEKACASHPHNTYIQLLSETGIIGFFVIFSLFIFIFYKLIKFFFYKSVLDNPLDLNFKILVYISIFITLWPFIPTGNFFGSWINTLYFLPFGYFLKIINEN